MACALAALFDALGSELKELTSVLAPYVDARMRGRLLGPLAKTGEGRGSSCVAKESLMRYVRGFPSTVPDSGANCVAFCNVRLCCKLCISKWADCYSTSHSSSACYGRRPLLNQRKDLSANGTYGPSTVDAAPPSASIPQSSAGALAVSRRLTRLHTPGIVS